MKIAIVTSYFQPEIGYEEYYLARYLAKYGHEVTVITSDRIFPFKNVEKLLAEIGSPYTTRKRGTGVSDLDGFTVYRQPCVVELFTDFNVLMNIRSVLKRIKPDIVHIQEPIQGGSAMAAQHKDLGFKLVAEQHGFLITYDQEKTLKNNVALYMYMHLRKPIAKYVYARADAITAITERTKQVMVDVLNLPEDKIDVIPLGTDEDVFRYDKSARIKLRKELGISPDTPLILTAGRLDPSKKLELLIKAFSKLRKELPARLIIIGTGDKDYEIKLQQLVKELKLEKSVKTISFMKKSLLAQYYCAADIGFWNKASITILEAMNCRLPVVIPDQKAIRDYVINENGLLFREDDHQSIYDSLLKLAKDKSLRRAMGDRALELVQKKYSYSVTTKRYLKLYKKLLGE